MDILNDMGVSKLSAKVFSLFFFFKVNYSFNICALVYFHTAPFQNTGYNKLHSINQSKTNLD